jgi:hypothetical protein
VDLPTPAVLLVAEATPLYADELQKTQLPSIAQNARVRVLATKGKVKQIQVVDDADTGKIGWISADKLANEP